MKRFQFILTLLLLLLSTTFVGQSNVMAGCCTGATGDINNDGGAVADISDLLFLVDYMFVPGADAPVCPEEGDVNGSGGPPDISDLLYLVDYMFAPGSPAPADCPLSTDIYIDGYATGTTYEAFDGSLLDGVQESIDSMYAGTSGLQIRIPGDAPWWTGGAFTDSTERDLTTFNCVTFWAKSSIAATLDVAGLANDNTGSSLYIAEMTNLSLTTSWQQYVIPIPLASKLTAERGLFYFAEGEGAEYNIWVDEIKFDSLSTITNPRPDIGTATVNVNVGENVSLSNGSVIFDIGGTDYTISAMPAYFTYSSSNPSVVSVVDGVVTAEAEGSATLTALLGSTGATGSITVNVSPAEAVPGSPAPTPTVNSDSVLSIYSDAYTPATTVSTFDADWGNADVADFVISSDNTKKYTNLVFAGIDFSGSTVDASTMSHFHMDIWTPDNTASPAQFKVKLVDFGADGAWSGGDDVEHELTFDENTLSSETWVGIDVPLSLFTNLVTRGHIAQIVISGSAEINTAYIDNIYFYDAGLVTEPEVSAPTPAQAPGNVLSLFSNTYSDATTVTTWSAGWDFADVSDFVLGSDDMKKYTSLNVAGIEFDTIDCSAMEYFHMDVWTPDATDAPATLKVKLVDYGANGVWGGGDDVEHELTFDEVTMNTAEWFSIDVPMTDFTNLVSTGHISQMLITGSAEINTIFVDNIYFYVATPTEPVSSAPTPIEGSGAVISLYSDAYTDEPMAFWSPTVGGQGWDDGANVYDQTIGGTDNIMKFEFFGGYSVSEVSPTIDASSMDYMHIDLWTSESVSGKLYKIKLVDYGPNGFYDGGDDTFHELTFDDGTMAAGTWISLDIPMTDFTGLGATSHLAQLVMSGDYANMYVDNIYFYSTSPTSAATTPSYGTADVMPLYTDSYTDSTMAFWSPTVGGQGWDDGANVFGETVGSDNIMKFEFFGGYSVSEISPVIDVSTMTHFSIDIWTPEDPTGKIFKIKLVDYGPNGSYDGGDDTFHELTFTDVTVTNGSWVTLDIAMSDFTGLASTAHMAQLVLSGDFGTVYVDNVLFHK